ncbi:putative MFS family arabinose efflux permease [Bradyrhizobium sp. F1.13.3]
MLALLGLVTPPLLLTLCFVVGSGVALRDPTWQSSVSEQVPPEALLAAIALNGMSYNIARSVGPAIGGMIVATVGAVAAFALNALLYIPLIVALLVWKRVPQVSRLPREQFIRAIVSGARYITNSPSIKIVLVRSMLTGLIGGGIIALMPIVARDLLQGGAQTYGLLLSAFGLGAVVGAVYIPEMRKRLSGEASIRACGLSMGGALVAVALSRDPMLTAAAQVLAGAAWMMAWVFFNVGVQLSVPRWVAGRSLAPYQAAGSGGVALGSWCWGSLADAAGVQTALLISGALMLLSPLLGLWLAMPRVGGRGEEPELLDDPDVQLALTGRSGPLVIETNIELPRRERARSTMRCNRCSCSSSAMAPMDDQSRGILAIRNCGPSATTARRGSTTFVCATVRLDRSGRWSEKPQPFTSALILSGSVACWNARLGRCAARQKWRTSSSSMRVVPAGSASWSVPTER